MQELANQHPALFMVAIVAFFLLTSMVAMGGVAAVGGWRSLAGRYRTERALPEHRRSLQRAQMRLGTNYNNILTLGSDAEGLYMAMPKLLSLGHPRLFIPWSEIQVEDPQRWFFFMTRRLRLGPDRIPLRVREALADFLLETRGGMGGGLGGGAGGSMSGGLSDSGGMKWGV
jgi:uncharacterized membrane protein YgcG